MSIRAALFDVDGVLVDSKRAYIGFYNELRAHVGLPAMDAEAEVQVFAFTFRDGFKFLIPEPLRKEAMAFVASKEFDEYLPRILPMPGAAETLAALAGRGIPIGVCSNGGRDGVSRIFQHFGYAEYVTAIVTSDDVPQGKPSPDGLLKLLDLLQAEPSETLYIGDSTVDAQAAQAAGIPFWAFSNASLPAARHVAGHDALQEAVALL